MLAWIRRQTYGTGLVIVSLKATFGFPITQGQLYSRSILWKESVGREKESAR